MKPLVTCLLAVVYVVSGRGLGRSLQDTSFVGKATDELSTAILQGYIDDDKNIAFSPLGYSAILAILAEGASGETRKQLVSALHLPEDQKLTRNTYHYILDRLRFRNEYKYNQPELKNYFYIYKNYTINEEYKKILEDFYLTDVKFVEKYATDHFSSMDDEDEKEALKDEKFEEPKESQEKLISYAIEDKPEKVDVSDVGYAAKNIKEQIALIKKQDIKDVKDGNEEETMVAVEARHHAQATAHVLSDKNDITSSLSVNSVGRKSSKSTNPLILIFNGMYFKGSWKKPFDSAESGLFYKSNTEKKQVPMMKTHGSFKTASLPDLDSNAILLPYDGGRYALMLLVPRARDGLVRLIADLPATSLPQIQESLQEEDLQVSLPSFLVETTTKPVSALAKFGVSSIFGHEAELAGVSEKEGLFVQELVQNVAVRVDNADSSASEILASNLYESEDLASLKNLPLNEEPRRFTVDHPFVFYILDCLDNVVVVSGKIIDPQAPDN